MSESKKIWIGIMVSAFILGVSPILYGQPCPQPNPILGSNQVCPGSQTSYTMSVDKRPAGSSYTWELFGTGGQMVGKANATQISIDWQNANGGPYLLRCTEQIGSCFYQNELQIMIADDLARRPFNCFSELSIPFDENCEKLILPEHLLTGGAPDCAHSFTVSLSINEEVSVPNPVGIEYLGQIITATVTHTASGRTCISHVLLKDGTPPQLTCTNDTTLCNDPRAWNPFDTSFNTPTVTDNCLENIVPEPQGYEWIQLFNDPVFDAYIIRSWSAMDKFGNRGTCEDTIFLQRVIFDQIVCPPDTLIPCESSYFDINDPRTSGVPTFNGMPLWSDRTYCDFSVKYEDLISHKCPGTYTVHRYWYLSQITPTVINEDTCHQIIEIVDTVGPRALFDSTKVSYEYHDDVFGLPTTKLYKTVSFPTLDYDCLGYGYFPEATIVDNCSNTDDVTVDLIWDNGHITYKNGSPQSEHLRFENLAKGKHIVTIKLRDACHNTSYDTLIAVAEDRKAPYIIVDKFPVVTLGAFSDLTWIDVSVFDEGTWDNCHLNLMLARRVDWAEACIDICDSVSTVCFNEHDTVFCADLQQDRYLDEIEAHYYETMQWLKEDGRPCSDLLWNAWKYALCEVGTNQCNSHYGSKDLNKLITTLECTSDFEVEGEVKPADLDIWKQLGGGWSDAIPFSCKDACAGEKVTIEILAIDASCNISRIWVDVVVEDKSAPEVQLILPDLEISCWAYNNFYRQEVESGNFAVFGKYEPYEQGPYAGKAGKTIIQDRICELLPDEEGYYPMFSDTFSNGLVLENCDLVIQESQEIQFAKCGEGWIERHFIFKGACNSSKADSTKIVQRIRIYNDCPLQEEEIIWPAVDTTIYGCSYENIETQEPRLKHQDDCREIGIHHKDKIVDVLYNADSTCLKVIRTWAVIDWCRQNAPYHEEWIGNQNYHYYEFDQIIYIKNLYGPEISDCDIDTVCIGRYCTGLLQTQITVTDDCTAPADIKISWALYQKTDFGYLPLDQADTNYVDVPGLEIGEYKLVWRAEDACHNVTFCTDHFTVEDCVKPTAICLTSTTLKLLPIDLNQDGLVDTAVGQIWAEEMNVSSYDNCFKDIDFRVRLKGTGSLDEDGVLIPPDSTQNYIGFGCQDIGVQEVEMWVVDAAGNADFCVVLVNIQAPVEGCNNELGKVKGTVSSMQGAGIQGVQMIIQNADQERWIAETNQQGLYDFINFAMDGSDHLLWPEKADDPINGISTRDVIKISKHLLSKEPLTSPFELMAADANGDGNVSVLDIINLRKLILGKIEVLPNAQPWQFFNQEMEQTSELDLSFDYKPLTTFTGIKVGDVNGDITNYNSQGRSLDQRLRILYQDQIFKAGQVILVPLYLDSTLWFEGLQMQLAVDANSLQIMEITGDNIDISSEEINIQKDQFSLSWFDPNNLHKAKKLMVLELKAVGEGRLSEAISLNTTRISAEAYLQGGITSPVQLVADHDIKEQEWTLTQNFPNPFKTRTFIGLTMLKETETTLRIFDLSGRQYIERQHIYPAGQHQIEILGSELGGAGLYIYEIVTAGHRQIRKMILTE